jgi:hypothetical protein
MPTVTQVGGHDLADEVESLRLAWRHDVQLSGSAIGKALAASLPDCISALDAAFRTGQPSMAFIAR